MWHDVPALLVELGYAYQVCTDSIFHLGDVVPSLLKEDASPKNSLGFDIQPAFFDQSLSS